MRVVSDTLSDEVVGITKIVGLVEELSLVLDVIASMLDDVSLIDEEDSDEESSVEDFSLAVV